MISSNNNLSGNNAGSHLKAHLAQSFMTSDENKKDSIRKSWSKGSEKPVLFKPDELDLYVDKVTLEAYIFHGKDVDYENIDHLEYNPSNYTVEIIMQDGTVWDLGVKIQWLLRPYFTKAKEVMIVQTKDGKSVNGKLLPFLHKDKKNAKR